MPIGGQFLRAADTGACRWRTARPTASPTAGMTSQVTQGHRSETVSTGRAQLARQRGRGGAHAPAVPAYIVAQTTIRDLDGYLAPEYPSVLEKLRQKYGCTLL